MVVVEISLSPPPFFFKILSRLEIISSSPVSVMRSAFSEIKRFGHLLKTLARGNSFEYGATESAPVSPYGEDFGLTIIPNYLSQSDTSTIKGEIKDIYSRKVGEVLPVDGRYVLPPFQLESFESILNRAVKDEFIPNGYLNHVAVNSYEKGDFMRAHVDNLFLFDDAIMTISIGAHALMKFVHIQTGEELPVVIPAGSLYFISGPARYSYFHMIMPVEAPRFSIVLRKSIFKSDATFGPVDGPLRSVMPFRAGVAINTLATRQIGLVRMKVDNAYLDREQISAFDTSKMVKSLRPLKDWSLLQQLDEDEARIHELKNEGFLDVDLQWRIDELRRYFKQLNGNMSVPEV